MSFFVLHDAKIHIDEDAFVLGDEFRAERRRSDTAQVERSHRELRSRFPDRLSGDNTNRLSEADEVAVSKVEAVAFCADATTGLASQG